MSQRSGTSSRSRCGSGNDCVKSSTGAECWPTLAASACVFGRAGAWKRIGIFTLRLKNISASFQPGTERRRQRAGRRLLRKAEAHGELGKRHGASACVCRSSGLKTCTNRHRMLWKISHWHCVHEDIVVAKVFSRVGHKTSDRNVSNCILRFKNVCLIDSLRALGMKALPYLSDGPLWAHGDGDRMLQPYGCLWLLAESFMCRRLVVKEVKGVRKAALCKLYIIYVHEIR